MTGAEARREFFGQLRLAANRLFVYLDLATRADEWIGYGPRHPELMPTSRARYFHRRINHRAFEPAEPDPNEMRYRNCSARMSAEQPKHCSRTPALPPQDMTIIYHILRRKRRIIEGEQPAGRRWMPHICHLCRCARQLAEPTPRHKALLVSDLQTSTQKTVASVYLFVYYMSGSRKGEYHVRRPTTYDICLSQLRSHGA